MFGDNMKEDLQADGVMPDLLNRTANAIRWEQTTEDIHDMLLGCGLSEYQAWLTYKGAILLVCAASDGTAPLTIRD